MPPNSDGITASALAWQVHREHEAVSYLRAGDGAIRLRCDAADGFPDAARARLAQHGYREVEYATTNQHTFRQQ